jgi:hypothetical protein
MDVIAYVGALALVVGGPVIAFLVRSGRLQKWPKAYYESDAGDSVRNGVFGLLPFSGMMGLALLGIAIGSRGGGWAQAALVCALGAFALFWLGLRWMKDPPEWLQPEWRLAAERGQAPSSGRPPRPRSRGKLEVSPVQYWLGWAILLAAAGLGLVFGFSAAIPVGIGVGLTYLLSTRPTGLPLVIGE